MYEALEKPLSRPSSKEYASARTLEALVEALLALHFLEKGLTRNAAGKAFQAWRALLAAILRVELDRLLEVVESKAEREWIVKRGVPKLPTTRLKPLSQLLERLGYRDITAWTSLALDLHDYQYHGPDPDMALSRYRDRREAAQDTIMLIERLIENIEAMRGKIPWDSEVESAFTRLRETLEKVRKKLGL
ncbi:PaREP1 family protein [Pyrolobus fumarii 1A]|uniref:PaREP1 family protein n=1 Tax=Pyrolobus fumarii (strain DSM 11204 / 1A) TaxID=694429 RepID=G0EG01_PYRF1|nr:PaREP1 family protein [Pyrolobus fumarii]AEM39102.1 PaREP1 family protein [Pyrolobus fumarii 1A]